MGETRGKPIILWLADSPKWAYASIVRQIGDALPHYEHRAVYMVSGKIEIDALCKQIEDADVVVPMYVLYLQAFVRRDNVAMFLSGLTPFE